MGELSKAIMFELDSIVTSMKRFDTWITLSGIFALLMLLYREFLASIFFLVICLLLDIARSYATGQVTEHYRKKYREKINKSIEDQNVSGD